LRFGTPKIDQHKIPLPLAKGPAEPSEATADTSNKSSSKIDTTSASKRLLAKPPPGKKTPSKKKRSNR